jgi:hypothetical protein
MKHILIILTLFFVLINVQAQEAHFQVITCKGLVVYENSEGVAKEVVPGAKIMAEGNLTLSENSMVKIISKDRPQKLQTPGTYDLSELYFSSDKKSMSFTGKFWNYLMKGLSKADSKMAIKKYGNQSAVGGIKGFSSIAESEVKIISPVVGKVSGLPIVFEWEGEDTHFEIFNSKNAKIFEKTVATPSLELKQSDIDLSPGTYYWQVKSGDKTSPIIPFEYQPVDRTEMESKLSRITDYVEGDELEKSWIRAVVYEMEGYNYEAGKMYEALVKNNPDDLLIRKLYILYLASNGNTTEAEKLIE